MCLVNPTIPCKSEMVGFKIVRIFKDKPNTFYPFYPFMKEDGSGGCLTPEHFSFKVEDIYKIGEISKPLSNKQIMIYKNCLNDYDDSEIFTHDPAIFLYISKEISLKNFDIYKIESQMSRCYTDLAIVECFAIDVILIDSKQIATKMIIPKNIIEIYEHEKDWRCVSGLQYYKRKCFW